MLAGRMHLLLISDIRIMIVLRTSVQSTNGTEFQGPGAHGWSSGSSPASVCLQQIPSG